MININYILYYDLNDQYRKVFNSKTFTYDSYDFSKYYFFGSIFLKQYFNKNTTEVAFFKNSAFMQRKADSTGRSKIKYFNDYKLDGTW